MWTVPPLTPPPCPAPPDTHTCRELCIAASAAPSGTSIICGGLPPTAATSPPPPPKMESQSCGTACPAPAVCMPGGASPAASDPTWPCSAGNRTKVHMRAEEKVGMTVRSQ
eukprot:364696-Chlamydomonas_euryale.AAC.15